MSAGTADTLPAAVHALQAALHRAVAPAADAAKRAREAAEEVSRGGDVGAAATKAGVRDGLGTALTVAAPTHPEVAIDALSPVLDRRRTRLQELRSTGLYPAIVALSSLVVAWLVSVDVVPQLDKVREVVRGAPDPTPVGATVPAVAVSSVLLVLFALALAADLPVLGYRGARVLRERALFLGALEGLLRAGANLTAAVRGAAGLVKDKETAAAAARWADALERGESEPAGLVEGLGAALLAGSIRAGTTAAALAPLVALAEHQAAAAARESLRRVRGATLVVAGLGLLLTFMTLIRAYGSAVGGGG